MAMTDLSEHFATEDCEQLTFLEMRGMINDAKRNGFDSAVFVGRNQMKVVLAWACDNDRITSRELDQWLEDDHRPEVEGLKLYLVNADDYWRVS